MLPSDSVGVEIYLVDSQTLDLAILAAKVPDWIVNTRHPSLTFPNTTSTIWRLIQVTRFHHRHQTGLQLPKLDSATVTTRKRKKVTHSSRQSLGHSSPAQSNRHYRHPVAERLSFRNIDALSPLLGFIGLLSLHSLDSLSLVSYSQCIF